MATEKRIGFFERYLTLWVFACIGTGILLGHFLPGVFQWIGCVFHAIRPPIPR